MLKAATAAALTVFLAAGAADAKWPPRGAWDVIRTTDPVTGASTCVVAALDYVGKDSFSRSGFLYPVVENNPVHGLLVGVSSGGKFRLPTGDIVWRVDDRPFRAIKAENNPTGALTPPAAAAVPPDAASKAIQEAVAFATKMSASMTATSTLASGERAKTMLAEMQAGKALIFRSAAVTPQFGLQSSATYRVGQFTKDGSRPIPIDASFRQGLETCGISLSTNSPPAMP